MAETIANITIVNNEFKSLNAEANIPVGSRFSIHVKDPGNSGASSIKTKGIRIIESSTQPAVSDTRGITTTGPEGSSNEKLVEAGSLEVWAIARREDAVVVCQEL